MIIDAHTHIFPPEVINSRERFLTDPGFSMLYSVGGSRIADKDDLLAYMDESGIDAAAAMAFPWHDENNCLLHNDYMSSVMRKHHGRVYCFGMVCVNSGRAAVKQQVRDIKNSGLAGIGELGFYASGFTHGSAEFLRGVLEAAGEDKLPVCLHVNEPVGHMYPGKYQPRLDELYMILADFREVTVILAHWGGGLFMYEHMPEVKKTLVNVFYDTAATPYLFGDGIYGAAIASAGKKKIIFGSDFPLLKMKRYMPAISGLDEDSVEMIMYRNAAGIFGL